MAEDKKSFVLYSDLIHTVRKMPKDKQADLFMTILSYVNDEDPIVDDLIVELVFEPIKLQMKRDLVKYENTKERRKEAGRLAGLKSGEARKILEKPLKPTNQKEPNEPKRTIGSKNEPNEHVTVNVNDTVNVNGTVIKKEDIVDRKLKFSSTLKPFLPKYGSEFLNDFYKYWVEPNKSKSKFKQELERTWDLERRLEMWARNDKNFTNKNSNGKPNTTAGPKTAYKFDAARIIETNTRQA